MATVNETIADMVKKRLPRATSVTVGNWSKYHEVRLRVGALWHVCLIRRRVSAERKATELAEFLGQIEANGWRRE